MTDENPTDETPNDETPNDDSVIDQMRDSGVGVEDPNITGDATPGLVDEQVQSDEPPLV